MARRKVKRKRKTPSVQLDEAIKKAEEWETRRRFADTKARYWQRRVKYYAKKVSERVKFQDSLIDRGQRAISFEE